MTDIVETDFGGFLTTLSDRHEPEHLTRGLGQEWETLAVGFKPYAACQGIHSSLDVVLGMRREQGVIGGIWTKF